MADSQHDKLFSRALLMLEALKEESPRSIDDLASEYGVDRRTIYRDVQRLHFFPIELREGLIYLERGYDITSPTLTQEELLVAELAFSSLGGIDEKTDTKLHTLRAKLTNPLFFNPYNIKPEGYEEINKDSELLNKIEDAIIKRNFAKVTSNAKTSEVEPYKVVAFDGIWYLLARDMQDKKIKTYFIAHIAEFRASSKVFSTSYVDIDAVLENVHTAWFEDGNSFSVKVKVKKEIAHYFRLKKHLNSQEILKENSDGSLIVTFSVSCDEDVDNLIKAWLPHIEVISPSRFRTKLVSELESYIKELHKSAQR
ncbi:MAG: transcriptional regulator [Campylobacterota bacterium]|nr:transcriptional regulator [Campylobacterota bacterium]